MSERMERRKGEGKRLVDAETGRDTDIGVGYIDVAHLDGARAVFVLVDSQYRVLAARAYDAETIGFWLGFLEYLDAGDLLPWVIRVDRSSVTASREFRSWCLEREVRIQHYLGIPHRVILAAARFMKTVMHTEKETLSDLNRHLALAILEAPIAETGGTTS